MDQYQSPAPPDRPRPVFRPYVLTAGRTRSGGADMPIETLVVATPLAEGICAQLSPQLRTIVNLCLTPMSIAEVAARTHVPLGVARVQVGDMAGEGLVRLHLPAPRSPGQDRALLERILNAVRAL